MPGVSSTRRSCKAVLTHALVQHFTTLLHYASSNEAACNLLSIPAHKLILNLTSYGRWLYFMKCRASDKCQREKRKTINGDDLLWAMSTLGFEEYFEPLKLYLHKYREVCCHLDLCGSQWQHLSLRGGLQMCSLFETSLS